MFFYLILNPSYSSMGIHTCQDCTISPNRTAETCRIINNIFLFPSFFPPDSMKDSLSITCSVLTLLEGARAQLPFVILCVVSPAL